jgi:hypothetical protein
MAPPGVAAETGALRAESRRSRGLNVERRRRVKKTKVPEEDQYKILAAFERERDDIIKMFKEIFAFPYVEETTMVMLEALTDTAGIGFDVYPNYEPMERAPLTEADRGSNVIRPGDIVSGGSVSLGEIFDDEELLWSDRLDSYLFVAEQLLVKWLGKRMKEVEGYDTFPYPICICFQGDEPYYWDLATGKRLRV